MGRMMGFEPTASGATIQRSNLLSYIRHIATTLVDYTREQSVCHLLFPHSFNVGAQ